VTAGLRAETGAAGAGRSAAGAPGGRRAREGADLSTLRLDALRV
jgi:hypothetical protein